LLNFLLLTAVLSTPLILAALGGYASERSGVINIGLEGKMLAGACAAALVGERFGVVPGLMAAILASTLLAVLHWTATQHYRIDHVISGMAINALAAGATEFFFEKLHDPSRTQDVPTPPLAFFQVLAFVAPFLIWLIVRRTRVGLRLVAVGSEPDKARLMGVQPVRIRFGALLATGVLTALAGAALVADVGVFTRGMTAGKGYIALAALVLGGYRPIPVLLACVGFGALQTLSLNLDGTDIFGGLPSQFWSALPYLATVIALAGFLGKNRTPAGLGKA